MTSNVFVLHICFALLVISCHGKLSLVVSGNPLSYPIVLGGFPKEQKDLGSLNDLSLVFAEPTDGCLPIVINASGRVLLMDGGNCYPSTKALNAQNAGAKGIIVFGYKDLIGTMKYLNTLDDSKISIFAMEVQRADKDQILFLINQTNVKADILPDENPFDGPVQSPFWIFYSILVGSANLFVLGISLHHIVLYLYTKKFMLLGLSTYSLLGIAAGLRLVVMLDPTGGRFILPSSLRGVLFGLPLAFNVTATITVALYWVEVFSKKNISAKFNPLKKYKWPYGIVISIVFILTILYVAFVALLIESIPLLVASGAVNTIVNISIFVFFCYACHLIHRELKRDLKFKESRSLLRKLFVLGIVQCVCLMIYFILGATFATPIANEPLPFVLLPGLFNFIVTILSIIQSLMFISPGGSSSSDSEDTKRTSIQLPKVDISLA